MQIHPGNRPPSPYGRSGEKRRAVSSRAAGPGRDADGDMGGRLIGVAVFAFGVLAILGMGLWAYWVFGMEDRASLPVSASSPARQSGMPGLPVQDQDSLAGAAAAHVPASDAEFQGVWEAPFRGGESAAIAFGGGRYQIILSADSKSRMRYYAHGAYIYDPATGVAVLKPSHTLPAAPPGLTYEFLTRREYRVLISLNPATGRLFLKPSVLPGVNDQVHPLFFHVDSGLDLTGWSRRTEAAASRASDGGAP